MTNAYPMRNKLNLIESNTAITREEFEQNFSKTTEKITFTFNGWDGKSYDGESRTARVIRTNITGYENVRFIKVGKALCYIDEDSSIVEKATGESHPEAEWLVDVQRA
ncbi:hypothetical protein [Eubacterium sp. AB3007]|uniref:hypothetical protein n=1 Tax=Eubacterium sp. AB3007 TaxID=1392487 RepID=UPI001A99F559|nr:hypothetical protein [Eubacterium sp. AB3007]